MIGSSLVPIIVPIVTLITLAVWLGMVYWADAHPKWGKARIWEKEETILKPTVEAIADSVAGAIGQRDDAYRTARLILELTQAQVDDAEERTHAATTIAQQLLLADVTIIGIMAAAALSVEQISLQLSTHYADQVPAGDIALMHGGLIGIGIITLGAVLSGFLATWCFLGKRASKTELGPDPNALAAAHSAAEAAVQFTLVLQTRARPYSLEGLMLARWRLRVAVATFSLSVLAGFLAAALVWRL